jgi:2-aminoadipate transaminase
MDTCTNLPAQRLLTGFLAGGHLDEHLRVQRAEYRRRKEAMQDVLAALFEGRARWTDPEGGFFLWLTFEPAVDTEALFRVALEEGVAFIPGNAFSPGRRFPDALRLCFASTTPERTREGLVRLRRAVDRVAG